MNNLARIHSEDRELARPARPFERAPLLDVYAGGLSDEEVRQDCIATISAGWKDESGRPVVSRDRKIILHDPGGRAPGLRQALEATKQQRLLIAFAKDRPSEFMFSRFAEYSASKVITTGDHRSLVTIDAGQRRRYEAGTAQYQRLLARCKVETWVYFHLAVIDQQGPYLVFPDGGLPYRLRFTSRNSRRNLDAALKYLGDFTGNSFGGWPFELAIDNRDLATGDGSRRNAPVFTFNPKFGEGARVDSRMFGRFRSEALAQAATLLSLPSPGGEYQDETAFGDEALEPEEISEDQLSTLQAGGLCDREHWIRTWHALARGSRYEQDDARAALIDDFTDGQTSSLADYLDNATEEDAAALIAALVTTVERERRGPVPEYDAVFESGEAEQERMDRSTAAAKPPAEPEPQERVDAETGAIIESGPASARPEIVQEDSAAWHKWLQLVERAGRAGIEAPPLQPPVQRDELKEIGRLLAEKVAEAESGALVQREEPML